MMDLHCHTNYSDSSLSVSDVMSRAREHGVRYIAITDHDTLAGIPEAFDEGRKLGISVIPGIEISAYDFPRRKKVHILGLNVDPFDRQLADFCAPVPERRKELVPELVRLIQAAGYTITFKDVNKYKNLLGIVYKQHIMHALLDKKYCNAIYCELYHKLFSANHNGEGGIAYREIEYIDAFEAVRAVKRAGGISVLAHPGQKDNFESIADLADAGLEGIEAYHPCHTPEMTRSSIDASHRFGLIVTGGTDYHGFYGEHTSPCGVVELDDEVLLKKLIYGLIWNSRLNSFLLRFQADSDIAALTRCDSYSPIECSEMRLILILLLGVLN